MKNVKMLLIEWKIITKADNFKKTQLWTLMSIYAIKGHAMWWNISDANILRLTVSRIEM